MSEKTKAAESLVLEELRRAPIEPPAQYIEAGAALNDEDFLALYESARTSDGDWVFDQSLLCTNFASSPALDEEIARTILDIALQLARDVARARKLTQESKTVV